MLDRYINLLSGPALVRRAAEAATVDCNDGTVKKYRQECRRDAVLCSGSDPRRLLSGLLPALSVPCLPRASS